MYLYNMNIRKIIKEEINKSNEWDWAKDVKSNQDIAQEIADESNLWSDFDGNSVIQLPFMSFSQGYKVNQLFKSYSLLKDIDPSIMFLDYLFKNYGIKRTDNTPEYIINPNARDLWVRYRTLITQKINK